MPTIYFPAERLRDVLYEEEGEIISDNVYDTSRWSVHRELIFRLDGKVYRTTYRVGATEVQDERPFEYDITVPCVEMVQKEVARVEWVPAE